MNINTSHFVFCNLPNDTHCHIVIQATLCDVIYLVDGLNFNLLSVSKLCDNGYHITFDSNACNLIDSSTNKLLYQGKRDKSMYYLYLSHFVFGEICLNAITSDSWLWHRRLN
jgi:hypothetical protein